MFTDVSGRTNWKQGHPYAPKPCLHSPMAARAGHLPLRVCESLWGAGGLAYVDVRACTSELLFV